MNFTVAYKEYMNKVEYIITQRIIFYNSITYIILEDDSELHANIRLYRDNIVTIQEEGDTLYVIVKAIFMHKYNDTKKCAFILVDWLRNTQ